ncbi:hypothetical protein HK102_005234, partial [Quaeritorhiza haematococci]
MDPFTQMLFMLGALDPVEVLAAMCAEDSEEDEVDFRGSRRDSLKGTIPTRRPCAALIADFTAKRQQTIQNQQQNRPWKTKDGEEQKKEDGNKGKKAEERPKDAEGWRELGNRYFKAGRFEDALTAYENGLQISKESESILLRLNKAAANLRLGRFRKAANDAMWVVEKSPTPNEKAHYRAGQALYGIGIFKYALQSTTGETDMASFARQCRAVDFPKLDCAEYVGPVRITNINRTKGHGLVCTREVAAGTLLICSKAVQFVDEEEFGLHSHSIVNPVFDRELAKRVAERAEHDSVLTEQLSALYAGPGYPDPPNMTVDHFRQGRMADKGERSQGHGGDPVSPRIVV